MSIAQFILGRRLASDETKAQQIGPMIGVAVLGLDAISSAAYGPEAAMTALLPVGTGVFGVIGPITIAIVVLLLILFFSYRQTISAYPQGGGSYTVARENLGSLPGLIAAAGLSIDYMLNVAVAISAGTGALVSAVPALLPYTVELCLAMLAILALANLRGVREAGLAFISPTYLFIGCMALALGVGIARSMASPGHPVAVVTPPVHSLASSAVGFWLILRAFASGCSAMTGVEAVSNGVPLFKQPGRKNAQITLGLIIIALVMMLLGIAFLVMQYHLVATRPGATGYQSILSQIFEAVFGRNVLYFVAISAVIMVLTLSANTSFAGFPGVCRLLAIDNFLPKVFAHRGRRLVYSEGIYILILVDALLIVFFKGITDRLIPLFAVGAFIAFTCSQAGMVMHWWRRRGPEAIYSMVINAAGAGCTLIALVIIFVSKFTEGAWLILLAVPILVMMFQHAKNYSQKVTRIVQLNKPVSTTEVMPPTAMLLIGALDKGAEKGIRLALGMGAEIYALHVAADEENIKDFKRQWKELVEVPALAAKEPVPQLVILHSRFRELVPPILEFIGLFRKKHPGCPVVIIIPRIIEPRWYNYIFRNTAMLLESNILYRGWPDVFVISTPMHLTE